MQCRQHSKQSLRLLSPQEQTHTVLAAYKPMTAPPSASEAKSYAKHKCATNMRIMTCTYSSHRPDSKATATSCCVHKPHPATASTFVVTRIYHKPDSKATTRWVSEPPSLFWSPPPLLLPANSCRVGVKYRIKCLHWKSPACIKERLSTSAHTSQSPTEKGVYLYKVLE